MMMRKKAYYDGVRMAPYDLVKEFLWACGIMTVLVVVLSVFFSSPDVPPLTLQSIARDTPQIFVQSSLDSLDGNSDIASYGPPYNNQTGSVQYIGPISIQKLFGVRIPVNTAQDFVLGPLAQIASNKPAVDTALRTYESASPARQADWTAAYDSALSKALTHGSTLRVQACSCGPVPLMMASLLGAAQGGAMDGLLLTSGHFYQTDFTRPLLFMQNDAVDNEATQLNLQGSQWGAMNETGNYPGQAWLWLFTLFYQIPPYTTAWAANTDVLAVLTITILSMILLFVPWIPGLRRIPKKVGLYRLIWRDYYREEASKSAPPAGS